MINSFLEILCQEICVAHALLIAGSEDCFLTELSPLSVYLNAKGHTTVIYRPDFGFFGRWSTLRMIKKLVMQSDDVLLVFVGHGAEFGWENGVTYGTLAKTLARVRGKLCVVNATCYGAKLLTHLRRVRKVENTCFLAPWDSEDISYPTTIADCVMAWSQGKVLEDIIGRNIYCNGEEDIDVPVQIRWGNLDHLFW